MAIKYNKCNELKQRKTKTNQNHNLNHTDYINGRINDNKMREIGKERVREIETDTDHARKKDLLNKFNT